MICLNEAIKGISMSRMTLYIIINIWEIEETHINGKLESIAYTTISYTIVYRLTGASVDTEGEIHAENYIREEILAMVRMTHLCCCSKVFIYLFPVCSFKMVQKWF